MRIGIDARLWNETGVGRYIRNLVKYLWEIDKINEYVLFVKSADYERTRNYELRIKNQKWKVVQTNIHWHSLEEQIQFPQILNRENVDLMHFPYFSVPIFYQKPFVVTIHDLIIDHYPTGKATTRHPLIYQGKRFGYHFVIKNAARKSKKIITVSEATKNEIIDHLKVPAEKVVVTYEGIDMSLGAVAKQSYGELPRCFIPRKDKAKYFLYVGNAYPHKNLEFLMNAFNDVVSKYPDVKIVLVGKEDYFYKRLLWKIEELALKDSFLFLQNVSDEELTHVYKNALALVFPSLMEGFGLPTLEAMSMGCLVVASDIPSVREVCQDAPIYFNPLDRDDLTQKLLTVLKNEISYDSNIAKGLNRAAFFSWEKLAKETVKVYESCVSL
jgi:glycosyltransferase involved in cell wall biosynthesis